MTDQTETASDGTPLPEVAEIVLGLCCKAMRSMGEFSYSSIKKRADNTGHKWTYRDINRSISLLLDLGEVELRRDSSINNEKQWAVTRSGWGRSGQIEPMELVL